MFCSIGWINYAIERYLESRLRELANDWDFEVTIKNMTTIGRRVTHAQKNPATRR